MPPSVLVRVRVRVRVSVRVRVTVTVRIGVRFRVRVGVRVRLGVRGRATPKPNLHCEALQPAVLTEELGVERCDGLGVWLGLGLGLANPNS